jgi:hypothetical protein
MEDYQKMLDEIEEDRCTESKYKAPLHRAAQTALRKAPEEVVEEHAEQTENKDVAMILSYPVDLEWRRFLITFIKPIQGHRIKPGAPAFGKLRQMCNEDANMGLLHQSFPQKILFISILFCNFECLLPISHKSAKPKYSLWISRLTMCM